MATPKRKGLGMGLESLLGPTVQDPPPAEPGLPTTLPLVEMVAGQYQPRTRMDEGALYELAESIKSQGVMQPILVRRVSASNRAAAPGGSAQAATENAAEYEIIAGERRFRAARLAGLDEVPVLVRASKVEQPLITTDRAALAAIHKERQQTQKTHTADNAFSEE